jgi:hypothetical protein
MPTAEARIETTRPQRYLAQLRDHLGIGGITARHGHPGGLHDRPALQHAEHGDRYSEFVFDWGTCKVQALDDALLIRAEAADEEALERAQAMIAHRIESSKQDAKRVFWKAWMPETVCGLEPLGSAAGSLRSRVVAGMVTPARPSPSR